MYRCNGNAPTHRYPDTPTLRYFQIYTDGATSGNPGPSGWGAVLISEGRREEIGGFEAHSTNNRMELTAVIEALRRVPENAGADVHSDSAYVVNGITQYIHTWRRNGFLTAAKKPVENRDLWETLDDLSGKRRVRYIKVEAHAGDPENERANDIAQAFSKGARVSLHSGTADAPARKKLRDVNAPAHLVFPAYIVFRGGSLTAYRTWDDCKTDVEGRRGARYKKCKTRKEFDYTLEKWGLRAMS
ncbi:ribonuclease HI [bacterium]|nr:ribonuclease HI [bacterium]